MPFKTALRALSPALKASNGGAGQLRAGLVVTMLAVGCIHVASTARRCTSFVFRKFIRRGKKLSRYGGWALVTGGTDGIGRVYCDELATQGLNIFLVAEVDSDLQRCAAEIAAEHNVETRYHTIDLAVAGTKPLEDPLWTSLMSSISDIDVGVLINNAGSAGELPMLFGDLGSKTTHTLVALNVCAVVKMISVVLPGMLERGKGAIVNMASVAGVVPPPACFNLYSASKAFVRNLSISLAKEYRSKGIDIQAQCPGFVSTKLAHWRPKALNCVSRERYVRAAMRHIGYEADACPVSNHAIELAMAEVSPPPVTEWYLRWVMLYQKDLRSDFLSLPPATPPASATTLTDAVAAATPTN